MKVQITDIGIQQMAKTGEPLNIVKYVLGSDYGYTPTQDATGIKGEEVYTSSPTEIEIINANVYKYQIGLDYNVGNFNFGEVALYDDKDNCVAIGVSEDVISKLKTSGSSGGNSVILGIYLSMAAKNYAMWIDALASDNQYSVPILESVDNLTTTADAYPNFYIIKGASPQQTSILAYTSKDGLWYFDAYSFANQLTLTVSDCTSTQIQFKSTGLSSEELSSITSIRYFGDKILEFTSGQVFSICRNIKSAVIVGNTVTLSLVTPLAILPNVGDTFTVFSRSALSTSDIVLPIATEDTLGGILVGERLQTDETGRLSYTPTPATVESIGDVKPGDYLSVREDGTLDVDLSKNRLLENLSPFNESESLAQLSKTGDEEVSGANGTEFSGARIKERQLTYGALYFAGTWNAETNVVNDIETQQLKPNGLFTTGSEDQVKEWSPKGWIFRVSNAGTTELDGISEWNTGDLVVCDGSSWQKLSSGSQEYVPMPTGNGFVVVNEDGTSKTVTIGVDDSGLQITREGGASRMKFGLTATGVTAGNYGGFIDVDAYGRLTKVNATITAGIF